MKHEIFGFTIADLNDAELDQVLFDSFKKESFFIATPNPEMLLQARLDKGLAQSLQNADLLIPDGVGLKFAIAAFSDNHLSNHLSNRRTGVDMVEILAGVCVVKKKRLLLLGGMKGSGDLAARRLKDRFPVLDVVTFNPGFVNRVDFTRLAQQVADLKPDVLAVALGQGKQEEFIDEYLSQTGAKIGIGIGGALDMISGKLPRAPRKVRKIGLEWLWRLFLQPSRLVRIMRAVIVFPLYVAYTGGQEKRFVLACRNVSKTLINHFRGL